MRKKEETVKAKKLQDNLEANRLRYLGDIIRTEGERTIK
jgi:hypothetical protein